MHPRLFDQRLGLETIKRKHAIFHFWRGSVGIREQVVVRDLVESEEELPSGFPVARIGRAALGVLIGPGDVGRLVLPSKEASFSWPNCIPLDLAREIKEDGEPQILVGPSASLFGME